MKTFKRTLAIMITCIMAFTLCFATALTAFAADPEGDPATPSTTLNLTVNSKDVALHTYKAYQIFTGNVSSTDVKDKAKELTDVEWGNGINDVTFLEALKTSTDFGDTNPFATAATANDVAKALANLNEQAAIKFAALAKMHLTASATDLECKNSTATNAKKIYEAKVVAGYYLILDKTESGATAISRNMLQVVGDTEIDSKEVIPTLEKFIVEGDDDVKANTASIGDTVNYKLKSTVPDMTGFEKFFFVVNDTIAKGLTFNGDVAITIGGEEYTDFHVNVASDGRSFEIVFENFISQQVNKGKAIEITYSAVLNKDADLTQKGNENKADLTYSNDPNGNFNGTPYDPEDPDYDPNEPDKPKDPDYPGHGSTTGKTPESRVVTYSTTLVIDKVDGDTKSPLDGAKFRLTGESLKAVLVTEGVFKMSENGTYYLLKSGEYTTIAPVTDPAVDGYNADDYVSTEQKYELVTEESAKGNIEYIVAEGISVNGKIVFKGLGAGKYTLTELEAPSGYNKLTDPIVFTISVEEMDEEHIKWAVDYDKASIEQGTATTESSITITIENNKGKVLPSTGGIGTRMFYLIGGLLAAGSAIFLITRKRMSVKEN